MRSSTWRALGNSYRVVEAEKSLSPERARELAAGVDGVLEIVSAEGGAVAIVIWNPDGTRAELSGNGTRIAAAWQAERTGEREIRVVVGEREVRARVLEGGEIEQDLGVVEVGEPEEVDGVRVPHRDRHEAHAVVLGDPAQVLTIGPLLETHPRFPNRTNVQVARIDGPGEVTARVWERGVGETQSSGTSAVAVGAATHGEGEVLVHFPGGDLLVRLSAGHATLVGPVERID